MKNTWALRIPAVFVFMVFAAASVFGQAVNNAQIHGRVTDAGGAAVAKALVKVTQTASGLVRTATSDSEGGYSLPYLPVGPYQLEVSAQGFQDYIQKGIILQVGQDVQVDVSLPTGGVSEKIEVDANAEMVETRETSVSTVIDQRRIVDLPLNGRQATQLIILSGAATNPPLTGNDLLSSKNYAATAGLTAATYSTSPSWCRRPNFKGDSCRRSLETGSFQEFLLTTAGRGLAC